MLAFGSLQRIDTNYRYVDFCVLEIKKLGFLSKIKTAFSDKKPSTYSTVFFVWLNPRNLSLP